MFDLVIDCGHGGNDSGAVWKDRKEKAFNLLNGMYLHGRFLELGVSCMLTRDDDISLENGTRVSLVKKGKRCLSCHMNATVAHTANHGEVIHSIHSNGRWANIIRDEWEKIGQPTKVYSRSNTRKDDYYYMHRLTGATETLILEFAFIDNEEDFNHYSENAVDYLEGVIRGYCRYVNIAYVPPKEHFQNGSAENLYRVQVGAFLNPKNAESLQSDLLSKGYDAMVISPQKETP